MALLALGNRLKGRLAGQDAARSLGQEDQWGDI